MKIIPLLRKELTNNKGLAPIALRISHRNKRTLIATGLSAPPENWDGGMIKGDASTSARLASKINSAQKVIANLELVGKLNTMTLAQIKEDILAELNGTTTSRRLLYPFFIKVADSRNSQRTREMYRYTLKILEKFDKNIRTREFEDIDYKYLTKLQEYLMQGKRSLNGAATHMQIVCSVFNAALDEEITLNYPFRKFKIKHSPTRKRNLGVEALRTLWNAKVQPFQQRYLDFFKLSFLLIGINTKDLCENGKIVKGRFEYIRSKTKRPYSIKIEPEAMEIINKYKGKNQLLNFSENNTDYRMFAVALNKNINIVGKECGIECVTMYYARHTWASLAAELDIPKETIARALGHSQNSVTDIYIDFDYRKVDDANRRVIDYALYAK